MTQDILNRYIFEDASVRGELVQLHDTYKAILENHQYPKAVQGLLGQLLTATSLLTATLKFEGNIAVQLQGNGPVKLAVINGDHEQQLRGVARFEGDVPNSDKIHDLIGEGHMVITITPKQGERYQGVVGLEGETLAECLEAYFEQSEQLKTRLILRTDAETHHAAGMLLQILPDNKGQADDFERLEALTETIKNEELFTLGAEEILYRLYNQESVKLFEPQPVSFFCGCSRERSASAILSLHRDEVDNIVKDEGHVTLHCDYCGSDYRFDAIDVAALFDNAHTPASNEHH